MEKETIGKYSGFIGLGVLVYQILIVPGPKDFISLGWLIPTWPMVGYAVLAAVISVVSLTLLSISVSSLTETSENIKKAVTDVHKNEKNITKESKKDLENLSSINNSTEEKNLKEVILKDNFSLNNLDNKDNYQILSKINS